VLRWYDRDKVVTLERGSFFYLAVFVAGSRKKGWSVVRVAMRPGHG
jgi:hypothetical protein